MPFLAASGLACTLAHHACAKPAGGRVRAGRSVFFKVSSEGGRFIPSRGTSQRQRGRHAPAHCSFFICCRRCPEHVVVRDVCARGEGQASMHACGWGLSRAC